MISTCACSPKNENESICSEIYLSHHRSRLSIPVSAGEDFLTLREQKRTSSECQKQSGETAANNRLGKEDLCHGDGLLVLYSHHRRKRGTFSQV